MYLSQPFPVDAPNFLRIFARLSRYPTSIKLSRRLETSRSDSPVPLRGTRESPRYPPAAREVDEKSRKRSRRRISRGWRRGVGRQAGVYKKWRLRNERRR